MQEICIPLLIAAATLIACGLAKSRGDEQRILENAVTNGTPGVQAIVRKGNHVWEGAAGLADVEAGAKMTLANRLRVASITKLMTYAVTMALVKRGMLNLDDRAVELLPPGTLDGIPYASDIAVRQLLDHSSGLHNFNGDHGDDFFADLYSDPRRGERLWKPEEFIAYARKPGNPPTNKPGEATSYSSTGFIVLEMILQNLSHKSMAQLYREVLFQPLGMTSAGMEGADLKAGDISDAYGRPDDVDASHPSPFKGRKAIRADGLIDLSRGLIYYNAWAHAAGAVALNVRDLAKFMDGVESGRFIVLHDQSGEFAKARPNPKSYFDWNGGSRGIQATILYEPAREITVIVITNASNAGDGSHDIAQKLLTQARNVP